MDWQAAACGCALAVAALAAYGRTFSGPPIFDDAPAISDNPSIRHLATALWPPIDSTVGGRPVLNLSFAINYALGGKAVWGYHALNLAIHILAAWVLLGIIRVTLARWADPSATLVAFCACLLWTLHPLQTEAVTYMVQRAESLMGLFYLLTLYCFIRGAGSGSPLKRLWYGASISACLLGMGTKEVMVSAPLIVLLYDRTFISGSFRDALRSRRWVYAGLAATWLALAFLVLSTNGRGGTVGFGSGVAWWSYALTQAVAIVRYLRLCLWPSPLVFDYGSALEPLSGRVAACALVVAGLAAATAWALVRRPALGFLGASFFAILAPSSSIIPVTTETMAEHRMYLPLVPVVVLAVMAIHRWLRRAMLPICLALAAVLAWGTWHRNGIYRSDDEPWSDTVAKLPGNARAHFNLGCALQAKAGRLDDAITQFREALRLKPDYLSAYYKLGNSLSSEGRMPEAAAAYGKALRLMPGVAGLHNSLGNILGAMRRTPEAIDQYEEAVRLAPDYVEARNDLGCGLATMPGRLDEAAAQFREALRLDPGFAAAHYNLGNVLSSQGRTSEAIAQYEEASRLKPDDAVTHFYLAETLLRTPGRTEEAVAHLKEVLRLQPGNDRARQILAQVRESQK
jgi:Flp pilus assembly protein TadD